MTAADYANYTEWKGWGQEPFGVYSRDDALYFEAELRRSGAVDIAGKTVLEIGFGNGKFAGWARDTGAIYSGTEAIEDLVAHGSDAGFNVYDARQPLGSLAGEQSVDLIVSFDVFEHLEPDFLRETLRSAYYLLKRQGRLIVRVPSGDSPFSRAIQHGDLTHRMTMGSAMVHQLANEAGLTVDVVREPVLPLRGQGVKVFLRRAAVTSIRTLAFAVMTRVFMGGGRPVLTPNMVFVLSKA